ncbi:DUF6290 family protein [Neobacillus sp. Marseille-QA0830]
MKLTKQITIRMSDEEIVAFTNYVHDNNLNASAWVRRLIRDSINKK